MRHQQIYEEGFLRHMEVLQQSRSTKYEPTKMENQNLTREDFDPVQQMIDIWRRWTINHKEAIQKFPVIESSRSEHNTLKNTENSLGNLVEQVVCISAHEDFDDFGVSKAPSATKTHRKRRIHVNRAYHKARKRRMKPKHHYQSSHLAFQLRSPRNRLFLGDDRLDSMAVTMSKQKQHPVEKCE